MSELQMAINRARAIQPDKRIAELEAELAQYRRAEEIAAAVKSFVTQEARADPINGRLTIKRIVAVVCGAYKIDLLEIHSARKTLRTALARQVAMYLARRLTKSSLPEIGRRIGNRDHSTVIHAIKVIERRRDADPGLNETLKQLEAKLNDPAM